MPSPLTLSEHRIHTADGTEIFYRAFLPAKPTTRALLLFHRGHEHSGRWQETIAALNLTDCAVFAWDQRGHGLSEGARGFAPNLADVVKDADLWARHLCATHGIRLQDSIVLAHSVGAVIATAWVHDYAPPVRGLILAVPAFRVRLYVPFALPLLRLKQKLRGPGVVKSYVKAKMITHDPEQAAAYQRDPLIFRQIAINMLLDLQDTSTRLLADAGAITTPTLTLAAGSDWVVKLGAERKFHERLGSPIKQFEYFPGFYHAIFHEKGRQQVFIKVRKFIDECFARPAATHGLLDADQHGYTKSEYDRLRSPGSIRWDVTRAALKTAGRLSQGIRLGFRYGFDSGVMLDYVYENRSRGVTPLGRYIDHNYLNSVGWRGIRVRRANLERVLRQTIDQVQRAGRPVHVLDIASGPGRYVLETLQALGPMPASATLRDYKTENLDAARKLAQQLGVSAVTFEQADAFDRASLTAVSPKPTIAIVSGLYELIPENAPLRQSLAGLAAAVAPGGFLIYTCQPWHPQVEFIARVLPNREGNPWIMRRRTQAEMDELVAAAGFEKISQDIDPWGIFTVSVARRVGPIARQEKN